MQSNVIIFFAIGVIVISLFFSVRTLRRKYKAVDRAKELIIPNQIPHEGVNVPILEGLAGYKPFGPVTFWQNNFAPRLVLFEDHIEYKVFRKRTARYSEIEKIHAVRSKFFNRLRFSFQHTDVSFTAVFTEKELLERVLDFLEMKGIFAEPSKWI